MPASSSRVGDQLDEARGAAHQARLQGGVGAHGLADRLVVERLVGLVSRGHAPSLPVLPGRARATHRVALAASPGPSVHRSTGRAVLHSRTPPAGVVGGPGERLGRDLPQMPISAVGPPGAGRAVDQPPEESPWLTTPVITPASTRDSAPAIPRAPPRAPLVAPALPPDDVVFLAGFGRHPVHDHRGRARRCPAVARIWPGQPVVALSLGPVRRGVLPAAGREDRRRGGGRWLRFLLAEFLGATHELVRRRRGARAGRRRAVLIVEAAPTCSRASWTSPAAVDATPRSRGRDERPAGSVEDPRGARRLGVRRGQRGHGVVRVEAARVGHHPQLGPASGSGWRPATALRPPKAWR